MCQGIVYIHDICNHTQAGVSSFHSDGEWNQLTHVCSAGFDKESGCLASDLKCTGSVDPELPELCPKCMEKGEEVVKEFLEDERYDLKKHTKAAKQGLQREERTNGNDTLTKQVDTTYTDYDGDVSEISDDDGGYPEVEFEDDPEVDEMMRTARGAEEHDYFFLVEEVADLLAVMDEKVEETLEANPTDYFNCRTGRLVKGCFQDPIDESHRRYFPEDLRRGYDWSDEFFFEH